VKAAKIAYELGGKGKSTTELSPSKGPIWFVGSESSKCLGDFPIIGCGKKSARRKLCAMRQKTSKNVNGREGAGDGKQKKEHRSRTNLRGMRGKRMKA